MDFKGLVATGELCVGEVASFEELHVASPQVGLLGLGTCHDWYKGAAMRRLVLVLAVKKICRVVRVQTSAVEE